MSAGRVPLQGSALAILSLLALSACNSGGNTFTQARCPCIIQVAAGDGQTGAPGTALPEELIIRVVDQDGLGVLSAPVTWRIGSGGGQIEPATGAIGLPGESTTDPGGFSRADWTLGPEAGTQTVEVTSIVASGVAVFTATAETP